MNQQEVGEITVFCTYELCRIWKFSLIYYQPRANTPSLKVKPEPLPNSLFGM